MVSPVIQQAIEALTQIKLAASQALMTEADHKQVTVHYEALKKWIESIEIKQEDEQK